MKKRFLKQVTTTALCASMILAGCSSSGQQTSNQPTSADQTTSAEAASEPGLYTPGTYSAQADGFGGAVKVDVTVDENSITAVTVTEHSETDGIGSKAIEQLPQAAVNPVPRLSMTVRIRQQLRATTVPSRLL